MKSNKTIHILNKSIGITVSISDAELVAGAREIGANEGIFTAPEGGALLAAMRKLMENGWIKPDESVVLFNTGSGIKHLEAFE